MKVESIEQPETYRSFTMVCLMAFSISLSFFYLGYTNIYYSTIPPETISRLYHIDTDVATAEGVLNGVVSIGGLIGCLLSSFIIRNFSRRNCLLVLDGCSLVFGFLIFIPNLYAFVIFRIGQGLCVGAFSSIAPLYLKEITPIEVSGMIGNFSQLSLAFGTFFVQFLSYILKKITGDESGEEFWIIIFGFSLLTQTLQIVILVFVFPYETPKYHLLHHEKKACEDLIRVIYKDEHF
jgi:MFS family permease